MGLGRGCDKTSRRKSNRVKRDHAGGPQRGVASDEDMVVEARKEANTGVMGLGGTGDEGAVSGKDGLAGREESLDLVGTGSEVVRCNAGLVDFTVSQRMIEWLRER